MSEESVELRNGVELNYGIKSYFSAQFNSEGALVFSGQDLPIPEELQHMMGCDEDYEYWYVIPAKNLKTLRHVLRLTDKGDMLSELQEFYSGKDSLKIEELLRAAKDGGVLSYQFDTY